MSPFTRAPRNLGTFGSADLNRRPNGARIDGSGAMTPTAPAFTGAAVSTVSPVMPRPQAPRMPVARAPMSRTAPDLAGMTGFAAENAAANAGVYEPGSFGAANAVANNTGQAYRPPQQTERANPLTGDSNRQVPMTTSTVRAPFSMRGATTPGGIDEQTVGGSMGGTFSRLRSNFNRPAPRANPYPSFVTAGT